MPIFLDRHDFEGLEATDVAEAHARDLQIEGEFGVRFLTYWFDQARGTAFCLIDAPDAETARRAHDHSHGLIAGHVIEVDPAAIEAFLGRVADVPPTGDRATPAEAALRAILFTDIVNSTGLASRLGDHRMVEMVRAHDAIVRRCLRDCGGREVKHTGDGIMASFEDPKGAVGCAVRIQSDFEAFNTNSRERLLVRIGIDAGEPVADSNDLFGSTVQTAARLCQTAEPGSILISRSVHSFCGDAFSVGAPRSLHLKGLRGSIEAYDVNGKQERE